MWDTVHLRVFDQSYVVSAGAIRRTHFYYEWRVVGKKKSENSVSGVNGNVFSARPTGKYLEKMELLEK